MTRRELFLKPLALMLLGRIKTALPAPTAVNSPWYATAIPDGPILIREMCFDCKTSGAVTVEVLDGDGEVLNSFEPPEGRWQLVFPIDKILDGNLRVVTKTKDKQSSFRLYDFHFLWEKQFA